MKDAQKPDHVNLNTLLNRLKEGRYVIPDFQREFEWSAWDILSLVRSIFLDYYIGSLLLWKGKRESFSQLSCEEIYGYSGKGDPDLIVLDGQQRLTAIHYVFTGPNKELPGRKRRAIFYIDVERFSAGEYEEAFHYVWDSKSWVKRLSEREAQFEEHIFPLEIVGSEGWKLFEWLKDYEEYWQNKLDNSSGLEQSQLQHTVNNAREFGVYVKDLLDQYRISYIELERDLSIDKICDIFTQVNSKGVKLDVFDLMNALLRPKGLKLKDMWRKAEPKLEFVDSERMNVYILQVMSILRQAYCSPKYLYYLLPGQPKPIRDLDGTRREEVLVSGIAEFEKLWNMAVSSIEDAIALLRHPQEYGVTSSAYLPYESIIPVFSALQSHISELEPKLKLAAKQKIGLWYWASIFTNRYSGSIESTSARDFLDVKAWIADPSKQPQVIDEFRERFNSLNLQSEVKKGTSIYNAVFNLLVFRGARDWITGNAPQFGDLDDHHIVPVDWGSKHLEGKMIHTVLNRSPLSAVTNRNVIRERLPNVYLPELFNASGEEVVRAILDSHFISRAAQSILLRNPFTKADFEEFLREREKTLKQAIEDYFVKGSLDLSPGLSSLDRRLQQIELRLREIIDLELQGNRDLIPGSIASGVEERIGRALKKNPALEEEKLFALTSQLEYYDLRDLQSVVISNGLWPRFEPVFKNKQTLSTKFDQIAELRNGIRHSRSIDEITKKEGEAALDWFQKVLKL